MTQGRALGIAAARSATPRTIRRAPSSALRADVDELAALTADNPVQHDRLPALRATVGLVCSQRSSPGLIAKLSELDATERELMAPRRQRLSTARGLTIAAFAASMFAALVSVAIAGWLQHRAVRVVVASEERFRMFAANASDLIRIHDASGQVIYASPSCERLLGYTTKEMVEMPPVVQLGHPDDLLAMKQALVNVRERNAPASTLRYRLRTKGGDYRWFETHTDPVRDRDGNLVRFYTSARDITERVEAQQQLEKLSVTDELTGLLNRRGFMLIGAQEYPIAIRQGLGIAIVFADLDGLKAINDELGHELGDRAIKQLGDTCGLPSENRMSLRASGATSLWSSPTTSTISASSRHWRACMLQSKRCASPRHYGFASP